MATQAPPADGLHRIITRVAAIRDVEPTALPPLQETIDVDALERLLDDRFSGTCTFTYADCEIRVGGHDRIHVSPSVGDVATDTAGQQPRRHTN